jgi:hypothetical protein
MIVGWLFLICCVTAQWNTLYDFQKGNIYLHLDNNDLLQLNFSITGFHNLQYSSYSDSQLDIQNNQQVDILPSPPLNATVFIVNLELYAIYNEINSDSQDCGTLGLSKFINNKWTEVSLDLSSLNGDTSFYQYATVLTEPANTDTAYVYGGICNSKISNRLLSIDMTSMKVLNISTATKPMPFFGASNVLAPNPQTQLIIGGQSKNSWLNMYQLATWDFSSGWSFQQVSPDDKPIDSRIHSLVLPIFDPLPNNSISTINDLLSITGVFLIGGEDTNGPADPTFAKLSMDSNNWYWNTSVDFNIDKQEILGAATIFNTLVIVNSTSSGKRDTSYSLNLYDINTYTPVSNLKTNVLTKLQLPMSPKSSTQSTQLKAILGTLIPIILLIIIGTVGYFLYQKHQNKKSETEDIDYQLGAFEHESVFTFHESNDNPFNSNIKPYVENDSSSTLGAPSLTSWVKKRQQYDQDRLRHMSKNFNESNDTLGGRISIDGATISDESEFEPKKHPRLPIPPTEAKLSPFNHSPNIVNRSMTKLKTSFSTKQSPTSSPSSPIQVRKIRSSGVIRNGTLKYDGPTSDSPFNDSESADTTNMTDSDVDDAMDVQFLVSSKRRSILKVVNPDLQEMDEHPEENDDLLIEHSDEGEQHHTILRETSIRQRVASGAQKHDEFV